MIFYENCKVYMDGKYPSIFLNGKNNHIHRLEWIKYYGNIPKGFVIHHKNENKLDWSIENLELMSRSDHILKHKRTVKRKGIKIIAIKNNEILHFESYKLASKYCNTYPVLIRRVIKGIQKQSNGWVFRLEGD